MGRFGECGKACRPSPGALMSEFLCLLAALQRVEPAFAPCFGLACCTHAGMNCIDILRQVGV